MTNSFKNPLLVVLLTLILVIGSYFMWKYLDIKNQELELKISLENIEIENSQDEKELSNIHYFTGGIARYDDVVIDVGTKWREGKMNFKINIPVTDAFFKGFNDESNQRFGTFTIELHDKDGFKIDSILVYISSLIRTIGDRDKLTNLSKNGDMKLSKENYKLIQSISISSTLH